MKVKSQFSYIKGGSKGYSRELNIFLVDNEVCLEFDSVKDSHSFFEGIQGDDIEFGGELYKLQNHSISFKNGDVIITYYLIHKEEKREREEMSRNAMINSMLNNPPRAYKPKSVGIKSPYTI